MIALHAEAELREAYATLRRTNANWHVHEGEPTEPGWLRAHALTDPNTGPLADLLRRIGERLKSEDKKVVACSFLLRFAWSAAAAVGPFLVARCVPDMSLENSALKFSADAALFERVALFELRGAPEPSGRGSRDAHARLRNTLLQQATPVVEALHAWSGMPLRSLWGQVLSSWSLQFVSILTELGDPLRALDETAAFFASPELAHRCPPQLYAVEHASLTRVYHCRGSCCLYYKTGAGSYCASCPLITQEQRLARNRAWMEELSRPG
ncbi:MAG TPA: (2Fe-2S)-binding protein [Polyangiales bacterium]|nr:(2Fe-2S)-binding protein [Polyangiales bacterium]